MRDGKIPVSVLDLMTILDGKTAADTFKNSSQLAQRVEAADYNRYWLAEHHNMVSVASAATSVLIGFIAGATKTLRVGSGGIMLPNHAPLVIAEQFGTLESLYPGRIDLGLGRAPGTDPLTARALRRHSNGQEFDLEIQELRNYFSAKNSRSAVRAIPGEGLDVPMWVLGSSTDSAVLAAELGMPYAFASHFAPTYLHQAIRIYRENFRPSAYLDKPYMLTCVNVITAETQEKAESMATSFYRLATGIITGNRQKLQPPVENMDGLWSAQEEIGVRQMMAYSFVGDKTKVEKDLQTFINATGTDEIMASAHIYDLEDKIKSYELLAGMDLVRKG